MSELTISHLTATLHPVDGCDDAERRVDRMLRHLAEHQLDRRLAQRPLPDGEWCVRRIDVALTLDPQAHEATTESDWTDTLLDSLELAMRAQPTNDVVQYRHRRDAMAELIRGVATGSIERLWAWRQLGLLDTSDPTPEGDPAGTIVAAARRAPEHTLAGVVTAVDAVGFASLHRALGHAGWVALATIVAEAAGAPDPVGLIHAVPLRPTPTSEPASAVAQREQTVLASSTIAAAIARSGVRPHGAGAEWAVLIVAEADPASLRGPLRSQLVEQINQRLETPVATLASGLAAARPSTPAKPIASQVDAHAELAERPDTVSANRSPERSPQVAPDRVTDGARNDVANDRNDDTGDDGKFVRQGLPSAWCGVMFLLATTADAGIPDRLGDPRLEFRSTRWVMHQLAQLLAPMAATDPAALAFAGLLPGGEAPQGEVASTHEQAALDELAAAWIATTVRRLDPTSDRHVDGAARVEQIARRRGEIDGEGGWTDVHLRLDDVDLEIRFAGLDIDPGWVPWLGVVVRFLYD